MNRLKIVRVLDLLSCKIKSFLSPLNIEVEYSIASSHSYPLVVLTINMCSLRPKKSKVDHGHSIVHVESLVIQSFIWKAFSTDKVFHKELDHRHPFPGVNY